MSEREMLERAAAAAGITVLPPSRWPVGQEQFGLWIQVGEHRTAVGWWSSLTDDGDCARLEAVLLLHVEWQPLTESVYVGTSEIGCTRPWGNNRQAARRYAATRAAAALAPTAQGE